MQQCVKMYTLHYCAYIKKFKHKLTFYIMRLLSCAFKVTDKYQYLICVCLSTRQL